MSDNVTRQPRDQRPHGFQLYASGRRVPIRATEANGRRTASSAVYDVDHDATTNLPGAHGLIRLEGDDSELVLVQDPRAWVETHEAELQAPAPRPQLPNDVGLLAMALTVGTGTAAIHQNRCTSNDSVSVRVVARG